MQNTKANFWIKLHPPTTKAMIIPMISFYPIQLVNVSATLFLYAHDEEFFKEMYNNLIHTIHVLMQVGVGNPLAGDQGQLHDETHHIPSQHKVRSVLVKPAVHTMSFFESTLLNTESTKVSPAVQHHSALLNNGDKQEVLFSLLWTILLKILLLHKDAVEIIC